MHLPWIHCAPLAIYVNWQSRLRTDILIRIISKYTLTAPALQRISISMKLEKASLQLAALGNPIRLKIYRLLVRSGDKGLPVGAIQDKLAVPASSLSHHIKELVETGLITRERQATALICRAHYPTMNALIGYLSDECCADGSASEQCAPASCATKVGTS